MSKKPALNTVKLARVDGSIATITLRIRLDTQNTPKQQQDEFWASLATAMICTMTPRQQLEFKAEIESQMRKLLSAKKGKR